MIAMFLSRLSTSSSNAGVGTSERRIMKAPESTSWAVFVANFSGQLT
jgi:hypothetical protein